MAKDKANRPKARLPRGFADRHPGEIRRVADMMETIRRVYERWGFEPVETPLIEFADALGKFLPDADRPNEGVFAFQDDDEQWLSLRYDLTAPLARMVAENFQNVPRPYKSYRAGWVFRNEKPGPGRFRQFMQFDADIVGAASPLADAEICMMAADTMEALGFGPNEYAIRVNSRRVLDGVLTEIGLPEADPRRLTVLRAIDKADKFPLPEIAKLLGPGREDESGDFTKGAGLDEGQAATVLALLDPTQEPRLSEDLITIGETVKAAGYDSIVIDPSVVRGLEYYTGAVFEAELKFEVQDEKGRPVRFGSVGGGGRYDGLVGRFISQDVPATGFSVGVSRLAAALAARETAGAAVRGPVIVTVMDRDNVARYHEMTAKLRAALNRDGAVVPVEMYIGDSGFKAQMKYADRRGAPCVIIQGADERAAGKVQIKDLAAGKEAAREIEDRAEWVAARPAQVEVDADIETIAAAVRAILT
ncbi:histidine--tRNA ligase [Acuticoccus sp. I52.16.1]|uniref:histidine--tRNA ligase n=1 Tax=Acuticoccus sp. I52.16.1 TaxID=2928472 RepID=UPI001FD3CEFC|nr:histidine--tRNA ligase [Acuticoccus sp. I52.16.1]UOM35925.1 histidine--tRNA ligase [Acuticoccus sp. I52.16.1]